MLLERLAEKMITVISLIVTDRDAIPTLVYLPVGWGSRELAIGFEQSAVFLPQKSFEKNFRIHIDATIVYM